nr:Uncharacterised protein [Streptococcus thermophilus]
MKRAYLTIAAVAAATLTMSACANTEMGEEGLDAVNTTTADGSASEVETEEETATETTAAATDSEAGGAAADGEVNQTEIDEWFKSVIGLGTTDQFVDAADIEGAPDWAADVIAVTVYDNELHIETSGDDDSTAEEIATLYADELKNDPPYDWGKDVTKVVVENSEGPTLAETDV